MPSGKQILIEKLLKYSLEEIQSGSEDEATEIIRGSFLLHGSHTPDNLRCVGNIAYKKFDGSQDTPARQGLFLEKIGCRLPQFVNELANIETIPEAILDKYPGITHDDYWNALHIVVLILSGLEWNSHYAQVEKDDALELKERLITGSIREYNAYLNGTHGVPLPSE